jgi:hypothetical protein
VAPRIRCPTKRVNSILTSGSEWKTPFAEILRGHLEAQSLTRSIDLGCALSAGSFDTERDPVSARRSLRDLTVSVPDRSLSYFTMRLLHKLQQLGTVGAIDYEAYAEPLTDVADSDNDTNSKGASAL